jgi:hypothetical protein
MIDKAERKLWEETPLTEGTTMRYGLAVIVTVIGVGVAIGGPWWVAVTSAAMIGAAWYDAIRPRKGENNA